MRIKIEFTNSVPGLFFRAEPVDQAPGFLAYSADPVGEFNTVPQTSGRAVLHLPAYDGGNGLIFSG